MKIFPAIHYTMGGLWVDYNLMSTIPGLFVLGEANFSDHGANRLGASALMQGLADGYFVIPYTIGGYFAGTELPAVDNSHQTFKDLEIEVKNQTNNLLSIKGNRSVDDFHRELGKTMWDYCGMGRNAEGLKKAKEIIPKIKDEFWQNVKVPGSENEFNQEIEKAGRVADYLNFAQIMIKDALEREESCGGHFREEHQTEEGEAKRNDEEFSYVAAWEYKGDDQEPTLHKEPLVFENVKLTQRSYK
jgi:succinate dehydrogenase / fumarate reductase flavoprotein subunit